MNCLCERLKKNHYININYKNKSNSKIPQEQNHETNSNSTQFAEDEIV